MQRERDRSEKAELTTSSSVEQSRIDREECDKLRAANGFLQARFLKHGIPTHAPHFFIFHARM